MGYLRAFKYFRGILVVLKVLGSFFCAPRWGGGGILEVKEYFEILKILGYFSYFRDFNRILIILKVSKYFRHSRDFVDIFTHFKISEVFCSF